MPYSNVPEELWDKMDSCVEQVQEKQPDLDKERAVAICYDSVVGKSTSTLTMSLTKVSQMSDGRIRWRARANSGETDSRNERCDISLFEDFAQNFWRDQELLPKGEPLDHPPTQLDIAHYSFYLPDSHRTEARVGWPIKVWTDGQALMMQGYFDETPLGQAAAKGVLADEDDRIKVSIGFYPDWDQSSAEDGVFTYRGGRGRARLDHLALTAHPVDLEARIVAGGKEMSSEELTLQQDALDVLGDEELVDELETLRATAKSEVPEGAVVKDEVEAEDDGGDPEEKSKPEVEETKADTEEVEDPEEEPEADTEPILESNTELVADVANVLRPFLAQLSGAIDERLGRMEQTLEVKASELDEVKARIEALATDEGHKVKAALDSNDGDWLTQLLRNSAQHKNVVKGGDIGPDPEVSVDSDWKSVFGNPED